MNWRIGHLRGHPAPTRRRLQANQPSPVLSMPIGKQRRRPEPGKTTTVVHERDGALKDQRLLPRQTVSLDHFVCSTKGRLFTSRGRSKDADMYTGGAIYVDMATNLVHVEFQRHLNTHATLAATAEFERMCLNAGVIPQEYLSDNGSALLPRSTWPIYANSPRSAASMVWEPTITTVWQSGRSKPS